MTTTADKITQVCDDVKQMLLDKNAAYGDSASNPMRVFSKADKLEAIRVRIDDKLSRIQNGTGYPGDNDVRDLVGYLLLYLVNDGTEAVTDTTAIVNGQVQGPVARYKDRDGDHWFYIGDGMYKMLMNPWNTQRLEDLHARYGPLTQVRV